MTDEGGRTLDPTRRAPAVLGVAASADVSFDLETTLRVIEQWREWSEAVAEQMIGKAEVEAAAIAAKHGCEMRVGRRETESFRLRMDYRSGRITVSIEGGIVQNATVG